MDTFHNWVKKKVDQIRPGEDCRYEADHFYREAPLSPKDPVKDLPAKKGSDGYMHPSWNERREAMWDDTIEVYWGLGVGIGRR